MALETLPALVDSDLGRPKAELPAIDPNRDYSSAELERWKRWLVALGAEIGLTDGSTSGSINARLLAVGGIQNNFAAGGAPTTGDDSDDGYSIGSRWIVPGGTEYVCVDASVGAAVWVSIGGVSTGYVDAGDAATLASAEAYADSGDAATLASAQSYADAVASGLDIKAACRLATTGALTLATDLENGDPLDGKTLITGDRVLVKDQAAGAENGIYIVQASGAPVRATDFDADADVDGGAFTYIEQGDTNAGTGWVMTTVAPVIGSTSLAFAKFSNVAISATAAQPIGSTASAGSTGQAADAGHVHDGGLITLVSHTADFTLSNTEAGPEIVHLAPAAGPMAITLPAASTRRWRLRHLSGAYVITILHGSASINGAAADYVLPGGSVAPTAALPRDYELWSDGTNWFVSIGWHGIQTDETLHATAKNGLLGVTAAAGFLSLLDKDSLFAQRLRSTIADDFITLDAGTSAGSKWLTSVSGTNASVALISAESGHDGIVELALGTTTTGKAAMILGTPGTIYANGHDAIRETFVLRVPTLDDGTDTFYFFVGICDASSTTPTRAACFAYNKGTYGDNWQAYSRSATGTEVGDTGVAVGAGTWVRLDIVTIPGVSNTYYINGVQKVQHTTRIVTTDANLAVRMFGVKTAGTNSRVLDVDLFGFQPDFSAAR